MDTNTVLRFLGWAALTYMWLDVNLLFFDAIADVIHQHNEQMRQKAIEEYEDANESEGESEDESEDENEDENEVVKTTVTKTFSRS